MSKAVKPVHARSDQQSASDRAIGMFVDNVSGLVNGAIEEVGAYLAKQSPAARARFIERCSSLIGTAAEIDAAK